MATNFANMGEGYYCKGGCLFISKQFVVALNYMSVRHVEEILEYF